MLAHRAITREDRFIFSARAKVFPRRHETWFFEAEDLIVVGVREFVEHDPRHAVDIEGREEAFDGGNVDALRERFAVALLF